MKILFLQKRVHKAGAQVSLDMTISALRKKDVDAQAIVQGTGWLTHRLEEMDALCGTVSFPSFRAPISKLLKLYFFARCTDRIWREEGPFDLIHSNDTWDALLARWLAFRWGVPWVVHLRNGYITEDHYYKYHCNKAHAAVAVSPSVYAKVKNWEYNDLKYIPNGLTLEAFYPPSNNNIHFPKSVGVIGDGSEGKGWSDLAESLTKVKKSGGALPERLSFLGKIDKKRANLIKRKIPEGIEVFFEGRVNGVISRIRQMDMVIVPSRRESYGRAMVETMAAGVPLLASRTGIVPYIMNDDSSWTFSPANPESLAEAWMRISSIWPERIDCLTKWQEKLRDEFLIEDSVEKLVSLYRKVL